MRYRVEVEIDGKKKYVKGRPGDYSLSTELNESSSLFYPQACEIMGDLDRAWGSNSKERAPDRITLIVLSHHP